jgi:hypothetical protein
MSKDKTKKKKIGWWRIMAKWVFSPLLSLGKQATKEAIPPEYQPLEELAVLSIDITEDIIGIYTDLNPENKEQITQWWEVRKGEVIDTSISSILFAAQEILLRMERTGQRYEHLSPREKQIYKIHKALED